MLLKRRKIKYIAIFCIIALMLMTTMVSSKNTEKTSIQKETVLVQKLTFFCFVRIRAGTFPLVFDEPPVVRWRTNGEVWIIGLGDIVWTNWRLIDGMLTMFIGTMTDKEIKGFAWISIVFIDENFNKNHEQEG